MIENFPKVTVIVRGYEYEVVEKLINVLKSSSLRAIEIALIDQSSKKLLEKVVNCFGDDFLIGAGTVLDEQDLLDVIQIGVKFALSPVMFTKNMFELCKHHNVISVPGAYSPSEIYESAVNGADIVKVFPANVLTPDYFKSLKAPLQNLSLMAVGGISEKNANEYLKNGVDFLGIGSRIFNKKTIEDEAALIQKVNVLEDIIKSPGGKNAD